MEFYACHVEGRRAVHLTSRSFLTEAMCGELATLDGEADCAVICADCHALALEAGGDPESWVVELAVIELRIAA